MPDFAKSPWSDIADFVRHEVVPVLLIVIAAYVALRLARLFVHGIVKTLLDREATEGTAQELSAVELKKRMDTLDALGANVAPVPDRGHRGPDDPRPARARHRAGRRRARDRRHRRRVRRPEPRPRLPQRRPDPGREPVRQGRCRPLAGVEGTVEDFTLRRTTLRDLDGVVHTVPNGEIKVASNLTRVWARINQDVTVAYGTDIDRAIEVVDEVGRTMAADPVWRRRVLEPRASSASPTWPNRASR